MLDMPISGRQPARERFGVLRVWPVVSLALAVVIWGTTFVVSENELDSMSPAGLTAARFTLALLVLAPIALSRAGLMDAVRSPSVAVLGATGVAAYYGLQNLGLLTTGAGTAAVLQAGLPVATAVIAVVWLGERLTRGLLFGLAIATAGVALVAGPAVAEASSGAALVGAAVIAYAVYTVLVRRQRARDSIVLAAATCTWGVILLLPWLAGEILAGDAFVDLDVASVVTLLYLGVVASALTLFLWTYGASRLPAWTAGVFTAAIPAVGYVCAVVTGEPSSRAKTVGCALALLGAAIAATLSPKDDPLSRRRSARKRPDARHARPVSTIKERCGLTVAAVSAPCGGVRPCRAAGSARPCRADRALHRRKSAADPPTACVAENGGQSSSGTL